MKARCLILKPCLSALAIVALLLGPVSAEACGKPGKPERAYASKQRKSDSAFGSAKKKSHRHAKVKAKKSQTSPSLVQKSKGKNKAHLAKMKHPRRTWKNRDRIPTSLPEKVITPLPVETFDNPIPDDMQEVSTEVATGRRVDIDGRPLPQDVEEYEKGL